MPSWSRFAVFLIGTALLVLAIVGLPEYSDRSLQLIEVLLSWPAVVGIIVVVFALTYQSEISKYLQYLSIRLPSGAVISGQPITTAEKATAASIELTQEQYQEIQNQLEYLKSAKEQEGKLKELLVKKQQMAVVGYLLDSGSPNL